MHKQQTELSSIKIMNMMISPPLRCKQAQATCCAICLPKENFILKWLYD